MEIPASEADLIEVLNLDKHAAIHPAPPSGTKMETVVVLEGVTYTRSAVAAALGSLDDATIQNILQYPFHILSHNNISGHGGAGGELEIGRILELCASQKADSLNCEEDDLVLNPYDEGSIADLVIGMKDLFVGVMNINSASLRKDGDDFVASVNIYDDEVHEVRATHEEVSEALGWDI